MKTKNRTFKIILLLTLSILTIAIMAIFPLVNNASAEAEINTDDEYIIRELTEGDNLNGLTVTIDNSLLTPMHSGFSFYTTENYEIRLQAVTLLLGIYLDNVLIDTIFNPLEPVSVYTFGDYGEITESILDCDTSFMTGSFPNPDYIPPVETEPTEEPENPINEITDFFSNASVAAIILLVLGAFVVYSIIKK